MIIHSILQLLLFAIEFRDWTCVYCTVRGMFLNEFAEHCCDKELFVQVSIT